MLTAILLLSLDVTPLLNRDVVAGERICDRAGLRTFYARRDARPAWDAAAHASLLRAVDALAEDGLEPNRYHRWNFTAITTNAMRRLRRHSNIHP